MADVSSYNLPVRSLSENVNDIQGMQLKSQAIQNNAINIDKNKLDLMNTQFGLINSELSNLAATPNITKDQALQRLNTFATTYKLPPEAVQHMTQELQQATDVKSFAENALRRGMDVQTKINQTYGGNTAMQNGQTIQPGVNLPVMQGGGFKSVGKPVQLQVPPTAETVDNRKTLPDGSANPNYGQKTYVGPQLSVDAPLPVAKPTNVTPTQTDRIPTSPPPLFEEGKKQLTDDQNAAAAKATALKPALQAMQLAKDLRSGPGTETWNKAVAFMKANNIIPIATKDDPTAIYQEFDKYTHQYLKGRGDRSDADLTAAEKSSPNAGIQINPALNKLLRSAIAQDRMEIARPGAFKGTLDEYGKHKSSFPTNQDQRAYELDHMEPKERADLINEMQKKYYKNGRGKNGGAINPPADALKFFKSLAIAREQGLVDKSEPQQ